MGLLSGVIEQFSTLMKAHRGEVEAIVTSAQVSFFFLFLSLLSAFISFLFFFNFRSVGYLQLRIERYIRRGKDFHIGLWIGKNMGLRTTNYN